jgi:hypothetical protein
MNAIEARAEFERAWNALKALHAQHADERAALQREYEGVVLTRAQTGLPKKKAAKVKTFQDAGSALGVTALQEIGDAFRPRVDEITERQHYNEKALTARLDELAITAEIRPGEASLLFRSVSSSSYSTQTQSVRYAEMAAEMDADVARANGIKVTIVKANERRVESHYPIYSSVELCDFIVSVFVADEIDVEILKRRPGPTLREQVRLCWKRGVNPRVYNPYLPPGYEERQGLDFQGNDLRAAPLGSPSAPPAPKRGPHDFAPGDMVRLTGKFLRNTQSSESQMKWKVLAVLPAQTPHDFTMIVVDEESPDLAYWNEAELKANPLLKYRRINAANLSRVGMPSSRDVY